MRANNRRYDIDWLRVIAIGLLIIYHVAIGFQPWGVFIGFIQNSESYQAIWTPMSLLNIWRIPLLFFVSGMGVWFAIQRRNWNQLLRERSKRILLPFVFGMLAIVPLHVFIWQYYYHQDLVFIPNPGHLWFLGNIFIYVLVLSPLFFYLKSQNNSKFREFLERIFSNPFGLILIIIPFIIEAEIIKPESFEMYAMTTHGFILGMIAFLVGFCCVYSGLAFWNTVSKNRWVLLGMAFTLYLVRVILFDLRTPDYLMSTESCIWIFTVFGFGYRYLNKPSNMLSRLGEAAYPVYIIHMIFLFLGSAVLFEMELNVVLKIVLLNLFTFIASYVCYEFIIRRMLILRLLFGMKPMEKNEVTIHSKVELV